MPKTSVLYWGDYCCSTGFATVGSNILRELNATNKFNIDVVAINYDGGPYDTEKFPGNVWPAISALRQQGPYGDLHGRQVFLDMIGQRDYDVVFIIQDTFILLPIISQILEVQRNKPKSFSTIYYFPFDCGPREEWAKQVVAAFDFPVAYTNYAKQEVGKFAPEILNKITTIYHGNNNKDFFSIDNPNQRKEIRRSLFGANADRYIITNLNRNQGRKDVSRSFMILKELRDRGYGDPFLYMHMQENDFGGSVLGMASNFGLTPDKDFTLPHPQQFSAHSGFPIDIVNKIYNSSDLYLTTTLGEGWGLSITEAMATKTPVVGPQNTSLPEILGDNERGWLVPSGDTPTHWIIKENDNDRLRPLMNVEKAADTIIEIMNSPEEVNKRVEAAQEWVNRLSWKSVCKDWINIFNKAVNKAKAADLLKNGGSNRPQEISWKK